MVQKTVSAKNNITATHPTHIFILPKCICKIRHKYAGIDWWIDWLEFNDTFSTV